MTKRYDKTHFIVYSNNAEPFQVNGENYCAAALRCGFDTATHFTEEDLRETPFWAENAGILEQERGAGYWLWKPYITLQKLREVGPNDIVVYNDVGRYAPGSFTPFPRFPQAAVNMAALSPNRYLFGFITDWLIQGHYTKRDCFIGLEADTEDMHLAAQISGGPIFAMPSEQSFKFLESWLKYAQDPHILTDMPDERGDPLQEFEDHRHDMAISSILLHQQRGNYLDFSKTGGFAFAEEVRRRNRHVPRAQTHAGYFSLMLERALPDDFFMREDPDLAEAAHIVRNLTDADPLPVHERITPRTVLAEEFQQMLRTGQVAISQDHLIAALSENRLINSKLHALSKMPEDITAPLWKHAVDQANTIAKSLFDSGTPNTPIHTASEAFGAAELAHPYLQTEIMVQVVWGLLDDDARSIFKGRHKNVKTGQGRQAMINFITATGHDTLLPRENELGGRPTQESERISALVLVWLAALDPT